MLTVNPRNAAVLNYYGYMLGDLGIRLDEAEALVKSRAEGRALQWRVPGQPGLDLSEAE